MKIALTFPRYNQVYYQQMLLSISLELRHNDIDPIVIQCGARVLSGYEYILSINNCRKDHGLTSSSCRFILWLQDCPYSVYRQLIRSHSRIKRDDLILFAAPQRFGFDWGILEQRGVKLGNLFYGYNMAIDLGIDSVTAKHNVEVGKHKIPLDSYVSTASRKTRNSFFIAQEALARRRIKINLCYPTTIFSGYYDSAIASMLYGKSSLFRPIRWLMSWAYFVVNELYTPFVGELSNLGQLIAGSKGIKLLKYKLSLHHLNSFSRIIERTLIMQVLSSLSSLNLFRGHLLLQGGLSSSLLTTTLPRIEHLQIEEYNALLLYCDAIICNNTHGLGLHPRVLDAMVAGTVVLHHNSPAASGNGVLENHFKPGIHYLAWSDANDLQKLLYNINNGYADLGNIAAAAYLMVKRYHSWEGIAIKLLNYLDIPLKCKK